MGGCPQSKVQVGANPGFTCGAPFSPSQQPLKHHSEPFEEERGVLACWSLPPPSSRGDGVGGFPLSLGEDLSLELFLPGLQGAARVPPSPASVSEHLWVRGGKPKALQGGTEEQISSLETEPRLGLYLLSPQPTSLFQKWCVCYGWLP